VTDASTRLETVLTDAWHRHADLEPATVPAGGVVAFRVRQSDGLLSITSHITGATYTHDLPAGDDTVSAWLHDVVERDVHRFTSDL
jgi:hypothetical protein